MYICVYVYLSIYLSIYLCLCIHTYISALTRTGPASEKKRHVVHCIGCTRCGHRSKVCSHSFACRPPPSGECLRLMRVRAGWMGLAVCTLLRKVHMHSTYIPHTYIQNSSRRTGVYVCVCVFIYLCRTPTTFLLCPVAPYLLCSALLCSSLLLSTFLDKIQTQIQTQAETDAGADAVQYRAVPCCVTWTIDV